MNSQIRQEQLWGTEDPAVFQHAEYGGSTAEEHIELNTNLQNTVLMMATASGGYAMRNFFITTLANAICLSDGKTDINTLFTRVSRAMSCHEDSEFGQQLPNFAGTMRKFLILPVSTLTESS